VGVSKGIAVFCGRLDFTHIYSLKKLMFLHKLVRQNNACLNVCFSVFKHSTEFLSLCRNFDLVVDQCSVSNVKCNVFSCFYNIVESRSFKASRISYKVIFVPST